MEDAPNGGTGRVEVKNESKGKSKVKGSGQECPLHTDRSKSRLLTGLKRPVRNDKELSGARFGMTKSLVTPGSQ